jgi:hypothetical protein
MNTSPHAGNLTITTTSMTAAATQVGNQMAMHLNQEVSA